MLESVGQKPASNQFVGNAIVGLQRGCCVTRFPLPRPRNRDHLWAGRRVRRGQAATTPAPGGKVVAWSGSTSAAGRSGGWPPSLMRLSADKGKKRLLTGKRSRNASNRTQPSYASLRRRRRSSFGRICLLAVSTNTKSSG